MNLNLYSILSLARPSKGPEQITLREAIRVEFGGTVDSYGNLWVDCGGYTVFSAHLDTVHQKGGNNPIRIGRSGVSANGGDCLGADDGAGVWLLCEMMRADVPGMYLFCLDEEIGCKGARVASQDARLVGMRRAVAFDRKGTADICVTQVGRKLCSTDFCDALADALNMGHSAADGVYTDNSEFGDVIPEIVNISVGYANAHGPKECLDTDYLARLAHACINLDWESLPVIRVPEPEIDYWESTGWGDDTADVMADDAMVGICDILGIEPRGFEYYAIRDEIVAAYHNHHGVTYGLR